MARLLLLLVAWRSGIHSSELQGRRDPTKDATKSYSYDAFGLRMSLRNAPVTGTTKNYLYAYDVHGSVGLLTEVATGTAEATYGYDAYGEKDADLSVGDPEDNNPLNPYRYSAKRFDSGSKTLDMGARRFDSAITRFLTPDFYLGAFDNLSLSLDPLTGNRYALAGGNPVTFEEWDGHDVFAEGGGTASPSPNPVGQALSEPMRWIGNSQSPYPRSRVSRRLARLVESPPLVGLPYHLKHRPLSMNCRANTGNVKRPAV